MSGDDERPDWTLDVPPAAEWDEYELAEWRDRVGAEWAADHDER